MTYQNWLKKKINDINNSICIKAIYFVIKTFPRRKSPGLDKFTGEFYKILKKEITHQSYSNIVKNRGRVITAQKFSKASLYVQLIFGNVTNAIQWEKNFFLTNIAQSNGYPQGKNEYQPSHHMMPNM